MTAPAICVRAATTEDVERLADWAIAMALETEHKQLDPDIVRNGVRAVLAEPARGRYFIAECTAETISTDTTSDTTPTANASGVFGSARAEPGECIGTLMLTHEWSDWRNGDWWWIQSVYVEYAHRRRGVYRALYDHVHALALATPSVCGLRLYVERENANAQRTYESLGMTDAHYQIYEAEFTRR
ncbi:MAG: GNAT family N-acetyltransferase [Lysobacteraceae bacterium]